MELTGKSKRIWLEGRSMTYYYQRCRDWTHPYPYQNHETLASAGCGIFSLCHASQWLTGTAQDPEVWADFSVSHGGRGDDGTDRPALLHALQASGEAARLGFRYEEDGLRNDLDTLWAFLRENKGAALCNLRVGHIVALLAAREVDGVRQLLAVDSVAESAADKVREHVLAVVPSSEVVGQIVSDAGVYVGARQTYGAFWVEASLPRDFNLLYRI